MNLPGRVRGLLGGGPRNLPGRGGPDDRGSADGLAPLRRRLAAHNRRLAALESRVEERLPEAVRSARRALANLERLEPQVASLEQRVEELRQRLDSRVDPGPREEQDEAERLVELVRREHEQIRSRMTAISWYEDRLRRLEEQVGDLTEPSARRDG